MYKREKTPQNQKTLRTAKLYRINQEIKFLYTKKTKLNEQLHKLHLKCAEEWQETWPIITQSIDYKLTHEIKKTSPDQTTLEEVALPVL